MEIGTDLKRKWGLTLRLTAHFNQQLIPSVLGDLSVAISGGDLLLDLNDMRLLKHNLYGELLKRVQRTVSLSTGGSEKRGFETTRKPTVSVEAGTTGPKAKFGYGDDHKETNAKEATNQQTEDVTYDTFQINALGGGEHPGWRFSLKTGDPHLEGSIVDEKLCECQITNLPSSISANFDVHQRFIKIQILDGIFRERGMHEILSPKKMKILNLFLWHKLIKRKVHPHLSSQIIKYE
jgi:hypothetical protein